MSDGLLLETKTHQRFGLFHSDGKTIGLFFSFRFLPPPLFTKEREIDDFPRRVRDSKIELSAE